ncbi:hypothetical protein D3C72_1399690 [compost metagenome]
MREQLVLQFSGVQIRCLAVKPRQHLQPEWAELEWDADVPVPNRFGAPSEADDPLDGGFAQPCIQGLWNRWQQMV